MVSSKGIFGPSQLTKKQDLSDYRIRHLPPCLEEGPIRYFLVRVVTPSSWPCPPFHHRPRDFREHLRTPFADGRNVHPYQRRRGQAQRDPPIPPTPRRRRSGLLSGSIRVLLQNGPRDDSTRQLSFLQYADELRPCRESRCSSASSLRRQRG